MSEMSDWREDDSKKSRRNRAKKQKKAVATGGQRFGA